MPTSLPPPLTAPDANDPLGYGLKSIAELLQRFWLIGKGNPYFDADVQETRLLLGLPTAGFENTTDFVNWAVTRQSRHGHTETIPISFTADADGQRYEELQPKFSKHNNVPNAPGLRRRFDRRFGAMRFDGYELALTNPDLIENFPGQLPA